MRILYPVLIFLVTYMYFGIAEEVPATGTLIIQANLQEAHWLLYDGDLLIRKGGGFLSVVKVLANQEYSIRPEEIEGYTSSLSIENPFEVSPNSRRIVMIQYQPAMGSLVIKSNSAPESVNVIIKHIGGTTVVNQKLYPVNGAIQWKSSPLPIGEYSVFLEASSSYTSIGPRPVVIQPNVTSTLLPEFTKLSSVNITINNPEGRFTLRSEATGLSWNGSGKKYTFVNIPEGYYSLHFESRDPSYAPPPAMRIKVGREGTLQIQATYKPLSPKRKNQQTLKAPVISRQPLELKWNLVPGGKSIIGDSFKDPDINALPARSLDVSTFYIGTYEVTNAEYASWLNRALQAKLITYVEQGNSTNQGIVFDLKGNLLCKTSTSEVLSQIQTHFDDTKQLYFVPTAGKEHYPVIFVSWYGADLFCSENKARLPTEAEWEKAGAITIDPKTDTVRKYRYGFSRDEIDPSWANYRTTATPLGSLLIKTKFVGFFNGYNQLTATIKTHDAKSPYGAYDMSGNVWEWVADWYQNSYLLDPMKDSQGPDSGTAKVAKGGCYDSLAAGVRVAERLSLPPDYCDGFTGFRAAKSEN